jgi:hypothetical protein
LLGAFCWSIIWTSFSLAGLIPLHIFLISLALSILFYFFVAPPLFYLLEGTKGRYFTWLATVLLITKEKSRPQEHSGCVVFAQQK